jgi:Cdc6-like AAA superfamily ATPase
MSSKRKEVEKPYIIEKVDTLPPSKKARVTFYDEIINEILQKEQGFYKVTVKDRHVKTVYSSLIKRIKNKPLKLHIRKNEIFIEKL